MSPRRRVFALATAILAVVLAVVLTILGSHWPGPRSLHAVRQDLPGPVLLVPGYGGGVSALERLAGVLRAAGREATVVGLPGDGTGPLSAQAEVLGAAARAEVDAGAPSVDVVGYSAGGVVARLWVAQQGGDALARRVVVLGSPQHGTDVAGLAELLAPGSCPPACQQLSPGSDLLVGLNRGDETPAGPAWVSIWSADDEVVTPPDSARLDGALDVVVQDLCPGRRVAHGQLPTDAAVQALVLAALDPGPPTVGTGCPGA